MALRTSSGIRWGMIPQSFVFDVDFPFNKASLKIRKETTGSTWNNVTCVRRIAFLKVAI